MAAAYQRRRSLAGRLSDWLAQVQGVAHGYCPGPLQCQSRAGSVSVAFRSLLAADATCFDCGKTAFLPRGQNLESHGVCSREVLVDMPPPSLFSCHVPHALPLLTTWDGSHSAWKAYSEGEEQLPRRSSPQPVRDRRARVGED